MIDSTQNKLESLVDEFDTAMLVTRSLNGEPRARPMAVAGYRDGQWLAFASRADDEKLAEIRACPDVAVTFQDDDQFISMTGTARVERDEALAQSLWSPVMKLWFPEGARDPNLRLVLVEPSCGEYWDRSGTRKLEFLWEAGKALLKGDTPDTDSEKLHAKVGTS